MSNTLTDRLAAALRACVHREGDYLALADAALAEYDAAVAITPRIVITMEGGLVQDVSANVPGIEFVKVDYDTEGADADDYTQVAQLEPDGTITGHADAFINRGSVSVDVELVDKRFEEAQAYEEQAHD